MIFESLLIAGLAISSGQPQASAGLERVSGRGTGSRTLAVMMQGGEPSSTIPPATGSSAPTSAGAPGGKQQDDNAVQSHPLPRITVIDPPRQQSVWEWKDRITWGANIVLALLGYAGIMLALSTLRKIERQTKYFEEAVNQAKTAADAALLHAEALARAERPWVMITVERSPTVENGSVVVATNRGKSPAKLTAATDRIVSAADEQHLPARPEYEQAGPWLEPIILLPGECAEIRVFGDEDVRRFCESDERFKRVQDWEERLFVYGKVIYKDLIGPADDRQVHETSWSCWYVAGKSTRGLVAVNVTAFRVLT